MEALLLHRMEVWRRWVLAPRLIRPNPPQQLALISSLGKSQEKLSILKTEFLFMVCSDFSSAALSLPQPRLLLLAQINAHSQKVKVHLALIPSALLSQLSLALLSFPVSTEQCSVVWQDPLSQV